ncbi:hypothetical protein BpHYR1_037875 [Brachionus plicatilis]|uniref:Uncharacterized protein n=1 Tax=Brachionus plicatilis TaxID=10195 RepID=A0A3M7QQH8_BRAPC|nr:hypothetical protein BpHYR1_037875 [Brachionus plicatilis]
MNALVYLVYLLMIKTISLLKITVRISVTTKISEKKTYSYDVFQPKNLSEIFQIRELSNFLKPAYSKDIEFDQLSSLLKKQKNGFMNDLSIISLLKSTAIFLTLSNSSGSFMSSGIKITLSLIIIIKQ